MSLHHHPDWNARPCKGHFDVYDTLIDYDRGPQWRMARRDAMDLCGGPESQPGMGCPLRAECFAAADSHDEVWHLPVAEGLVRRAIRRLEADAA